MTERRPVHLQPAVIAVAPNGARRTDADHPALPMGLAALAATAAACAEAGAALLHLHVRDATGGHVLDPGLYGEATAAVRAAVGERLILQITTEAVGRYTPAQQRAVVRAVRPEAVSLAVRELIPEPAPGTAAEREAALLLAELAEAGTLVQPIVYDAADTRRLVGLMARGVVPEGLPVCPLFVLGRYSAGQTSHPADLLPFLTAWEGRGPWALCAFGPAETACAAAALALGGHARVGFENNLWRPDGQPAADNAEAVARLAALAPTLGRRVVGAAEARALLLSHAPPFPQGPPEA